MEVVKKMAAGNLNVTVSYKSRNELGALASGINEMAAKLDAYIHHDGLTGLRNTAAYRRSVERLKQRSQKEYIPYALVIFDANFLKQTNDRYGHEAGNELICRIASRISSVFAHSPAFRVGGDEFIVILEGSDYENREKLLVKFDEAIAHTPLQFEGHEITVSVARGMAVHREGQSYADLFQQADTAMYQNKADIKAKTKWKETWAKQQET
jgi:diguanylate cyclase (GGDEF)-like protein